MSNNRLILASASARRKELLENLGLSPSVFPADIVEAARPQESPEEYAKRNSIEKVMAIWERPGLPSISTALAADTIVVSPGGQIFEKPRDEDHALAMLTELSGQWHRVVSAFALAVAGQLVHSQIVETQVLFGRLDTAHILSYIRTKDPFDKSGSYGIQGISSSFVSEIKGSYTNVMGLPMYETLQALHQKTPVRAF